MDMLRYTRYGFGWASIVNFEQYMLTFHAEKWLDLTIFIIFITIQSDTWTSEYGDPKDPEAFDWLIKYSPLENVNPNATYPAVLVTTSGLFRFLSMLLCFNRLSKQRHSWCSRSILSLYQIVTSECLRSTATSLQPNFNTFYQITLILCYWGFPSTQGTAELLLESQEYRRHLIKVSNQFFLCLSVCKNLEQDSNDYCFALDGVAHRCCLVAFVAMNMKLEWKAWDTYQSMSTWTFPDLFALLFL